MVGISSNTRIAGTTTGEATYSLDWSFLPVNKQYNISFSFVSDKTNIHAYNNIAVITISLGQINSYRTSFSSYTGRPTDFLGGLVPYITRNDSFLYADTKTNVPICLMGRPRTNRFDVKILSLNTGLPWTDFADEPIGTYGLTLAFEEVGNL
jgi:hypothetical protein